MTVESTTTTKAAPRATTSSTTDTTATTDAGEAAASESVAAPATTAPPTTAPAPVTTAAPAPTTTPPTTAPPTTVATSQSVTGRYVSPDGNGRIVVELMNGAGRVIASQTTGPSGGDFSFAVDPGTYRLQITDSGPGSDNRTSGQVVTRTESFTLEAGRSARFECHVRTGCTGGVN